MKKPILFLVILALFTLYSCNKEDDDSVKVDCSTKNITVETVVTNAACGSEEGNITASATGGTGTMQFKLDEGSFQNSGNFSGLKPGIYKITAEDADGCSEVATVHLISGISFQNTIKPIIDANCAVSGCHVSGTARTDLNVFNNIKQQSATIKSLTQTKAMPKTGSLSDLEIEQIACWVDDGALNN